LLGLIQGTNQSLNVLVARTLGNLGTNAVAAVPAVLAFVKAGPAAGASSWDREKTSRLRMGAIDLLGRMGPNAKSAVPALRQLANQQGNESERREITEALQRIELNPQEL
jgi:hypothetical protein